MMHNNAHIAAVDADRVNDVRFAKTLSVHDWYHDGGDGFPLGVMQLIGKVQGVMMKSYAKRVPLAVLDQIARRSVEWLVMAEDLPSPREPGHARPGGRVITSRERPRGTSTHARLIRRAKRLLRAAGYDFVLTQPFDISMNSHMCGTVVAGVRSGHERAGSAVPRARRGEPLRVDAGFFPSSAAVNPALTIAAQALRVVDQSELAR